MAFIPVDKMKKLRDSARSGDERAAKILSAQLKGDDFSSDLDSFFTEPPVIEKPATKPVDAVLEETPYQMYLRENELEDNEDNKAEFELMTGGKVEKQTEEKEEKPLDVTELIEDENEAIRGYDSYLEKLSLADVDANVKANVSSKIQKIIADERQHNVILDEIKAILCDCENKIKNNVANDIEVE